MFSQQRDLVERALDERLRRRPPVLGYEFLVQRSGVDPDADRYAAFPSGIGDFLDVLGVPHVAGVETQPVDAGLEGE